MNTGMLICKMVDDDASKRESCNLNNGNDSHEYQTASELFDFMAKNQNFNTNDGDLLTPRDLVFLYKNIDIGTKLMTNANEFQRANQHVETVVHNDEPDSESSDFSDIFSNEDIHNVFLINKERLDFFNSQPSVDNTVCHKFGDIEIQTSNNEYDKHFLFKDPYIKEQLRSFNLLTNSNPTEETVLPASLLDYVCCKRLEDNYNFYMDNIIIYVKNTIEQLKRISNGDYLTDRAKEKWREVERVDETIDINTKVLATSTSIPLHVECKTGGRLSTWDDIVHSAVDIRSLSKILEKKIVFEIPKLISGSYTLLSKCCADNLIISCKKDEQVHQEQPQRSRVDVVFQLKPSETGHLMSNINSIMILQTVPIARDAPLSLMPKEDTVDYMNHDLEGHIRIIELNSNENIDSDTVKKNDDPEFDNAHSGNCTDFNDDDYLNTYFNIKENKIECNDYITFDESDDEIQIAHREAFLDMGPDDLHLTIRKISLQSILPEECTEDTPHPIPTRKKSPKVRIKSPYENKSYIMEEKKRRKMLAIREKREQKKMVMAKNSKAAKPKYGKVTVMPQPSSSVTKLSITNKSFYNSIYGQCSNADLNQLKNKNRSLARTNNEIALENVKYEQETDSVTPAKDLKKIINRSYYLDDTLTEMMFVNMKQDEEDENKVISTASTPSDYQVNLNLLSQLIAPSETEVNVNIEHIHENVDNITEQLLNPPHDSETNRENCTKKSAVQQSALVVPSNTPKISINVRENNNEDKKIVCSIECRKSIDKIYNLMKKLENCHGADDCSQSNREEIVADKGSSSIQVSDSGTSLKHHLTSSNPSSFSFDKNNNSNDLKIYNESRNDVNVIPKVVISSKKDAAKSKPERRRADMRSPKVQDNPLQAISQLLRDFENVQKNRVKSGMDQKFVKRTDPVVTSGDAKTGPRPISYKRQSRIEQHNDSINKYNKPAITPKEKKIKPLGTDVMKNQQAVGHEDKNNKKKISDILDEAKEARGEAVRGPSKFNSRLSSLAQPKRIYVQAHSEEYQTRYGRNLITDRLQRLAAASALAEKTTGLVNIRNKAKRISNDAITSASMKQPLQSGLQIEQQSFRTRFQRSSNCSPDRKEKTFTGFGPSYNTVNVHENPEILKKMVAVESYVNNHYKPPSFSTASSDFQYTQNTRTPLLPNDIDITSGTSSSSPKRSTEAGSKLHHIITSIVKSNSHGLDVLEESFERNSKSSIDNNQLGAFGNASLDSDYTTTATTDDGIAPTNNGNRDIAWKEDQKNSDVQEMEGQLYDVQPCQSVATIEKYNTVLSRHLSIGTFTQCVGAKDLSPNSSIHKIYFLQSSDTKSANVVLKASISQNSQTERLRDLMTTPILSKPCLEWSFTNIPMQMTTVGYAFAEYGGIHCGSSSLCKLFQDDSIKKNHNSQINKSTTGNVLVNGNSHKESQGQSNEKSLLDRHVQNNIVTKVELTQDENHEDRTPKVDLDVVNKLPPDESEKFKENNKDVHRSEIGLWEEKHENLITSNDTPDNIDYTTSLDILVALLTEIKKITTCQTNLANNDDKDSKELETILKKSYLESSIQSSNLDELSIHDVSITSLEKLRFLESNPSLSSYYLSDNLKTIDKKKPNIRYWGDTKNCTEYKPMYADKEIDVDIIQYERVSRPTDVPSIFFPTMINHNTNVTNSILGEFHQTSTQSLFSFTDYYSTSNESFSKSSNVIASTKEMIELPKISNLKKVSLILSCNKTELKNKTLSEKDMKKRAKKLNIDNPDFDSVMNMKRDILVTVYSMLVLTVFTALSFPEMLMIHWL